MFRAQIVDYKNSCVEQIFNDVPSTVLERIQECRPTPERAVDMTDMIWTLHELLSVADAGNPSTNCLGAMSFASAIASGQNEHSPELRVRPNLETEASRFFLKFLELRMPRGFELQVLGVPACAWPLHRNRLGQWRRHHCGDYF